MVGPAVAGSLAQHASWRWVFFGLVPFVLLGSALLVPVLRSLPRRDDASAPGRAGCRRRWPSRSPSLRSNRPGSIPPLWSAVLAVAGLGAIAWGLHSLLPAGTWTARRGVPAAMAVRALMAGALFGIESLIPLSLTVQHHYSATVAALPLMVCGITWAIGSWYQGRDHRPDRRRLVRVGFVLLVAAALLAALAVQPSMSGVWMFVAWGLGGAGAGLGMSSASVLMLACTTDAERGADSASLQISDAVSSALTTGLAGVLVAAAARGALGYGTAFTGFDLSWALWRWSAWPWRDGPGHRRSKLVDDALPRPRRHDADAARGHRRRCGGDGSRSATPRRCTARAAWRVAGSKRRAN